MSSLFWRSKGDVAPFYLVVVRGTTVHFHMYYTLGSLSVWNKVQGANRVGGKTPVQCLVLTSPLLFPSKSGVVEIIWSEPLVTG